MSPFACDQSVNNKCLLLVYEKYGYMFLFLQPGPEPKPKLRGDTRTFRVWLDPNQYQQDMTSSIQNGTEDPYETFNIIMRRKPKENNFKVTLSCDVSHIKLFLVIIAVM